MMTTLATSNSSTATKELSRAAASQLLRLGSFRRSATKEMEPRNIRSSSTSKSDEQQLRIPIDFGELMRIFEEPNGESVRDKRNEKLSPAKMDALNKYADKIIQDERVQLYMRERIKRDGYGGIANKGGSGAFVSGLAGQLVGGVVGLASTASKGSSSFSKHSPAPVYGPPAYHSYSKDTFNIWDFKRAILNTLIQAVKAVSGGVLALKGQLIKGGGYLVATKGKIISSAGEAISGLGKNLASSAVVQAPHQTGYGHIGYAYEAPAQIISHDLHYNGPPPSSNNYHSFGTASDEDAIQPGLLIAKPSPSVEIHSDHLQTEHLETDHHHSEHVHVDDVDPRNPSYNIKETISHLTGTSNFYQPEHLTLPDNPSSEEPSVIPENTLQLQDNNKDNYDLYPPLGSGPSDDEKSGQLQVSYETSVIPLKNPATHAHKYNEFPPITLQDTLSGYPKLSSQFQPPNYLPPASTQAFNSADIHLEISDHDITGFETGGYSQHVRAHPGLHVVAMQGPLKIPILGPRNPGFHTNIGSPPGHLNSLNSVGKYAAYGPSFEIQQSIGYELRRAISKRNIHRI